MMGPTGVGVLFGKYELLKGMVPLMYGGGMNEKFDSPDCVELKDVPTRFEAGTPNIAGVIGLGKAIDYLLDIGMDNVTKHELELKKYFLDRVSEIDNITIYNRDTESGIVAFNINDIFSQDTAVYLNHYKICVRAGNHCAKMLKEDLDVKNTCRISFYIYNTKEEIDKVIEVLKDNKNIFNVIL
jgi:cysteine desulfurase/selenocysteine lyase